MPAAQPQRRAIQLEERRRIAGLRLDGPRAPGRRLREPWLGPGRPEPERRRGPGPGDRHATTISAADRMPGAQPGRVLQHFLRQVLDLLEPQLLALIEIDRAWQRELQQ